MTRRHVLRALALAALVWPSMAVAQRRLPGEELEDLDARDEWFWGQRTYPFAERPLAQMSRLHESLLSYVARTASSIALPPLGGSWRPLGPSALWVNLLETGRISAILPAATPGGPMYVATASGGVWRSTNSGLLWTPLTDNECSTTTGALARDPATPTIVYAATGEGNSGMPGCGVLRSADGGNVWSVGVNGLRSTGGGAAAFTSLLVDPTSVSTLIGTTNFGNAGVMRSTTAGSSWAPVLNTGPVSGLVAHPTQAGTFFVGNRVTTPAASRGVYRSTNSGVTWTQLPAFPVSDINAIGRIELAVSRAAPTLLWALVGDRNTGGMLGVFRFDQVTNTWSQLTASGVTTGFGTQQSYDLVITVDPRDERRIFIAGVRAFRSTDGGATFRSWANEVHVDWHALVFDPNNADIMWAGTDGGVYQSTDAGDTWISRSYGLAITQFYPGISIHPQGTRIAGGTQDNGTHVYTGTAVWDAFLGSDGGYTAINFRDPSIFWGETQWSSNTVTSGAPIFRRDVTGTFRRSAGIVTTDRAPFIPALVMDPVNPAKLYFGTFRLYRTTNDGGVWAPITGDLSAGTGTVTSIAISPADTNTIYVGTSDGRALVSRDGGTTFTLATGLPTRFVTRVVAHPTDPLRALVTVSGFGTGHVFETSDAFATVVRNISGNLIDAPAQVALYVASANVIAVGTDVGVFQTADGGTTWMLGPAGLPNVIVEDLAYQPSTGLLVAGTYGRGMFAYNVGTQAAVLRGDANGDGRIDAFDALLIQQALASAAPAASPVYPRGDANCNGVIDAADLVLVLRAAVGLSTGAACVGTNR